MPPMPKRVAAIKQAIEERQDFSVLGSGGEAEVRTWAKQHGMNGCALILEWQQNYRQAQAARGHKKPLHQDSGEGVSKQHTAVLHDLDYWGDEPSDDGYDDDDPMPVCGACKGSGRDRDGNKCLVCGGRGKIPAEDQPDDGEDDDDEKE